MLRRLALFALFHFAPARAQTLTLATYNIENYCPANRMTADGFRGDYPKPEAEKQALRAVIRSLGADVIVLQEIGPRPYLEELRRDLAGEGLDYPHAIVVEAEDRDRHLGLLSKLPLKSVVRHTDLDFAYFGHREKVKRGLLEAVIATAAGDVTIFAVHLKSRLSDRADDPLSALRRAAEATAVRDCILRLRPDPGAARYVILGDCNDTRNSRTLQRLERRGQTVVAERLPAADSRGETWTEDFRREDTYTQLDHILVSPGLLAAVRDRRARIFDGAGVAAASDHRPLFVVLTVTGIVTSPAP